MDFAPYQSSPPEHSRVASPEYSSPRASWEARRPFSPPVKAPPVKSPPPLQHPQPTRGWSGFDGQVSGWVGASDNRGLSQPSTMPGAYPAEVSEFDTSLGMRLDYEACLAYLAFPPLGAIILLILERNSDYVRCVNLGWLITSVYSIGTDSFSLLDSTLGNPHCYSLPLWYFICSFHGRPS